MNNIKYQNTIKTFILAAVLVTGMSFVDAEIWSEPGGAAPVWNNVGSINKSQFSENKVGSLAIGYDSLEESGILDTGFRIDANGTFASRGVFASGALTSTEGVMVGMLPVDTASRVIVGGKIGIGIEDPEEGVHLGEDTTMRMEGLAHDNAGDLAICADVNGTLILCPQPGVLFAIITGPTVTSEGNDQDMLENNETDNNCRADVSFTASATGGAIGAGYTYSWRAANNSSAPLAKIKYPIDADHIPRPAGIDTGEGAWVSTGTGSTSAFTVYVKNPASAGRDDWTVELTATDGAGTTAVSTSNFTVWNDAEGCY